MARKSLFLGIAYLTGIHGFLICAPYLVIFGGGVLIARRHAKAR